MSKSIFYYLWVGGHYFVFALMIFGIGLMWWAKIFGVPCWAFDGGAINDTITREIIERCKK